MTSMSDAKHQPLMRPNGRNKTRKEEISKTFPSIFPSIQALTQNIQSINLVLKGGVQETQRNIADRRGVKEKFTD